MNDDKSTRFQSQDEIEAEAVTSGLSSGTLNSRLDPQRRTQLEQAAAATSSPVKERITTRLPARDLARLKAKAIELGIPYQTLLASVVHRYVEGTLVDRDTQEMP